MESWRNRKTLILSRADMMGLLTPAECVACVEQAYRMHDEGRYYMDPKGHIVLALEWTFTGRVFPAREALAARLVSAVHAPGELLPAAHALARQITENAGVSIALARKMFWRMLGADHPTEAHKIESRGIFTRGRSADVREGVTAFLEKRKPHFVERVSTDMPSFFPWWQERSASPDFRGFCWSPSE